jgi:ribosomal protein S27AE
MGLQFHLLTRTGGNSKNEVYVEFKGIKMQRIFVKCPKCGKESLVAYLEEKSLNEISND